MRFKGCHETPLNEKIITLKCKVRSIQPKQDGEAVDMFIFPRRDVAFVVCGVSEPRMYGSVITEAEVRTEQKPKPHTTILV